MEKVGGFSKMRRIALAQPFIELQWLTVKITMVDRYSTVMTIYEEPSDKSIEQ